MDTREVPPVGKSSQTMETKRICILVVNDDIICNNIVADMLQNCKHEVLQIGGVLNVLNAIWETRDKLDLVLTNVHKLELDEVEIVKHIREKLKLPILFMCPEMNDKKKTFSKDQPFSFAAYILHGSSQNVISLWKYAFEKEKAKMVSVSQEENARTTSIPNIAFETKNMFSSINEAARFDKKSTNKELKQKNETGAGSNDDPPVAKKPRVVWTVEMHQKFLEAIELIGHEKAVPKKIVEVMGIPGLTRENVASHLQKYRGSLKRTQQTPLSSLSDNTTLKGFEGFYNLPSPSASRLNSLQRNTTPLSQTSYTSIHQESITTSNSQCLNTRNKFAFGNTSRMKTYMTYQKYVPNLPNVRIYGDQVRNMLLTTGKSCLSGDCNQPSSSRFVGYRLKNDGNSIEFGSLEASENDKISSQTHVSTAGMTYGDQPTTYTQCDLVSGEDALTSTGNVAQQLHLLGQHSATSLESQSILGTHQHENTNASQCVSMSVSDSSREQLAFLSRHGPMTENLVQSHSILGNNISRQQITAQELGMLETANTEKCNISLFDQDTALQSTKTLANPLHDLSPNDYSLQMPSMPFAVFPRDQDFSMPPLETSSGNDLLENPMQFLEGISQSQDSQPPYSPPSLSPQVLYSLDELLDQEGINPLEGNGSTPRFDCKKFDDELFRYDD